MKVKLNDPAAAPGAEVAKKPAPPTIDANGIARIKDSTGRMIGVRKLSPLDKMRLFSVVGPQNANNGQYMGFAVLAASVTEIDGTPESFPMALRQLEAMIAQLDDPGTEAVASVLSVFYGKSAEEEMEAAKK